MGHEYKIKASFSGQQISDIKTLLTEQLLFIKRRSKITEKEIYEFRDMHISQDKTPYSHIEFDVDGIYIRNNLNVDLWTHNQSLKIYLEEENIPYNITDYGD